jgi:hypothetical protein
MDVVNETKKTKGCILLTDVFQFLGSVDVIESQITIILTRPNSKNNNKIVTSPEKDDWKYCTLKIGLDG